MYLSIINHVHQQKFVRARHLIRVVHLFPTIITIKHVAKIINEHREIINFTPPLITLLITRVIDRPPCGHHINP
jgi:hypothetical protein